MVRQANRVAVALAVAALPAAGAAHARMLPPAPWIDIAPGQRLAVVLDGPDPSTQISRTGATVPLANRLYRLRRALHRRVGTTMLDFYPVRGLPLHLSGGARMIGRRDLLAETERFDTGWLFASAAARPIFIPFDTGVQQTPGATIGYQYRIGRRMLFGVEGGAMLGRVPGYRPTDGGRSAMPGQFLDDGRLTVDPTVALYLSAAL